MATITIHGMTHRNCCIEGADAEAADIYDEAISNYIEILRSAAAKYGHTVVFVNDLNSSSYTVDVDDYEESQSAHDFMQTSPVADFWSIVV